MSNNAEMPELSRVKGFGAPTNLEAVCELWVGLYANSEREPRVEAHVLECGATVYRLIVTGGWSPLHVCLHTDLVNPTVQCAIEFLKSQAYHKFYRGVRGGEHVTDLKAKGKGELYAGPTV